LIYDIQKINFHKCVRSEFFEAFGFVPDILTKKISGSGILPKIYSFPKFDVIRFSEFCPSLLTFNFLTVYSLQLSTEKGIILSYI